MTRIIFVLSIVAIAVGSAAATPLIGRAAPVSKPFQAFVWVNAGYNRLAKSYNWTSGEYEPLGSTRPVTTWGAELWGAVGLPGRNELNVIVPAWVKTNDSVRSRGIGDVTVLLRHGLPIPSLVPLRATLALAANLPASDLSSPLALDDHTFDLGAGLTLLATPPGPFAVHGRAGYWLSGEKNDTTRPGNLLEYVAVFDLALGRRRAVVPELALSGSRRSAQKVNGTPVANTDVQQHYASVLLLTRPLRFLVIRPKAGLPLTMLSKGGSLPAFTLGLDIWASLP